MKSTSGEREVISDDHQALLPEQSMPLDAAGTDNGSIEYRQITLGDYMPDAIFRGVLAALCFAVGVSIVSALMVSGG